MSEMHRGQLRFAERFIRKYREQFLYAHGLGERSWHEWDGSRWAECKDGAPLRAVRILLKEALGELAELEPGARKALFRDIATVEAYNGAANTLKWAASLPPCAVAAEKLDHDPMLFNVVGGTIHMGTGKVTEPDPSDHITKIAGCEFRVQARSELFDSFLCRILPDAEVRAFVQRLFGLAMLGEVREHVMPIFTGKGRNGKGTLRDAVKAAFGDYAIEVDPEILMERRGEVHSTERMDLRGARLVFCSETQKNRRFSEAMMKRLTGGDPIRARRMRKDTIEFDPSHLLVMLTNDLPEVSGDDFAVWERVLVVPFDVVIPKPERDPELPGKLKAERAAVLSWVYHGWLDYQRIGLAPPKIVRIRTEEYHRESDHLSRFLAEETVRGSQEMTVRASALFASWEAWCRRNGQVEKIGTSATLGREIMNRAKDLGITRYTNNGAAYRGIGLSRANRTDHAEGEE